MQVVDWLIKLALWCAAKISRCARLENAKRSVMIDGYGGAKERRVPLAAAANQAHLNRKLLSEAPVLRFIKYHQLD